MIYNYITLSRCFYPKTLTVEDTIPVFSLKHVPAASIEHSQGFICVTLDSIRPQLPFAITILKCFCAALFVMGFLAAFDTFTLLLYYI